MADYAVRTVFGHRTLTVAEVDGNDGNAGRARSSDIGRGIANHDRVRRASAGCRDGPPQYLRIGVLQAERVLSADRREAVGEVELLEQQHRQSLELVGADGKPVAAG